MIVLHFNPKTCLFMDKQVKNASACSHYCLMASTTTIHTTLANVVARRCSTPGKILEAALESAVDLRRSKSADLYTNHDL